MRKFFYGRLAAQNFGKNRRFYFPYLLTGILTVAMYYNMMFLLHHPSMQHMPGGEAMPTIMSLGSIIVGLFSVIFLYYTNSFLMKRRQKELGLYNILGMGKRHIARVLLWETVYTCMITIVVGVLFGILLSKLFLLILCRLLSFEVQFGFEINGAAIGYTAMLFAGIYFLALLSNLLRLRLSKPVELLRGGNVGEKEPKTKFIMAVLGIGCLTVGYLIANLNDSPIKALELFFLAVLLVVIGTYLVFTAGSILLLKILRKNKNYYYKIRHFTAVSGMLYRMKQNAVGLGNICILSTMVLVMVSTTVSLYLGTEDALSLRYPNDIYADFMVHTDSDEERTQLRADMQQKLTEIAAQNKLTIRGFSDYISLNSPAEIGADGTLSFRRSAQDGYVGYVTLLALSEYNHLTGENRTLEPDQMLYCSVHTPFDWTKITVGSREFRAEQISSIPVKGEYMAYLVDAVFVIVPDSDTVRQLLAESDTASSKTEVLEMSFDLNGNKDQILAFCDQMKKELRAAESKQDEASLFLSDYGCREEMSERFYAMYGGLLFLGLFLGALFLMATVLIIYYKQISEGYEDQSRFAIMRKVGMSSAEIRGTIRSQVLIVFFLPLGTALIHLAAAFHMIQQLLLLLNLTNVGLFAVCTAATLGVFALVYGLVYVLTSRVYYSIISTTDHQSESA